MPQALLHEDTEHFFQLVSNVSVSRGLLIQELLAVAEDLLVVSEDLALNASAQVDAEIVLGVFTVIGDFASEGLPQDEENVFQTPGGTVLHVMAPSSARVASGFVLGPVTIPPIASVELENCSVHVISWATNLFGLEDVSDTMVTVHVRRDGEHLALDNLDPPLQFFLHVNERLGAFDRSCVFWDTVSANWSGHGLEVARKNLTQVGRVMLGNPSQCPSRALSLHAFNPTERRYGLGKVSPFHVLLALPQLVRGCNPV